MGFFSLQDKQNSNSISKLNQQEFKSIAILGNCKSAMPKLKQYQPNEKLVQESIKLLSYRSYCYSVEGNYQSAQLEDKSLLVYLRKTNDLDRIKAVESHLEFLHDLQNTKQGTFRNEPIPKRLHDRIKNAEEQQ